MAGFSKVFQGLIAMLAVAAAGLAAAPAAAADLIGVRFGPGAEQTRIVFDLAGAPDYVVSGDGEGAGRLFIRFASLDGAPDVVAGKGHVAAVRFQPGVGGVQATLEFRKTASVKEIFVLEPKDGVAKHRLVVDLQTAGMADFLSSLPQRYQDLAAVIEQVTGETDASTPATGTPDTGAAVSGATGPQTPSLKQASRPADQKWTIVIDPGHGGRDPGAQGQSGTLEKVVNLQAAEKLKEILEARGRYNVVLTRNGDETIRPDRREAMAREAGAELFISLHADALAQPQVRGASVYTLSQEGVMRSATLAKSQGNVAYNLDLNNYDSVVGGILLDQAQRTTLTNSSKFAQLLLANLTGKTPMLNRSHRRADLRVLLAPDVPAVLLEMAFISNAKDEANLNSLVWRRWVMTAVADSIDAYFDAQAPDRHARLAPAAGQ